MLYVNRGGQAPATDARASIAISRRRYLLNTVAVSAAPSLDEVRANSDHPLGGEGPWSGQSIVAQKRVTKSGGITKSNWVGNVIRQCHHVAGLRLQTARGRGFDPA